MRILDILEDTTVDGPGFRTTIYCAGCLHHCPGCHNPQSWDMNGGHEMSVDDLLRIILADPFADVTFSGGDPFYQAEAFTELACAIRSHSQKTIWCYTGFTFEQLLSDEGIQLHALPLLRQLDVLVDGPYIAALRDPDLPFRGSSNQRILDVPRSLQQGKAVEWTSEN